VLADKLFFLLQLQKQGTAKYYIMDFTICSLQLLLLLLLLLSGAELPLVENFGLLNDFFPFSSILDAGYPVFDLHLADVLFDVILSSVLESSL
jgi:hypothetical protein